MAILSYFGLKMKEGSTQCHKKCYLEVLIKFWNALFGTYGDVKENNE